MATHLRSNNSMMKKRRYLPGANVYMMTRQPHYTLQSQNWKCPRNFTTEELIKECKTATLVTVTVEGKIQPLKYPSCHLLLDVVHLQAFTTWSVLLQICRFFLNRFSQTVYNKDVMEIIFSSTILYLTSHRRVLVGIQSLGHLLDQWAQETITRAMMPSLGIPP